MDWTKGMYHDQTVNSISVRQRFKKAYGRHDITLRFLTSGNPLRHSGAPALRVQFIHPSHYSTMGRRAFSKPIRFDCMF